MRLNNRPNDRIRPMSVIRNYIKHLPGSCLIEIGSTKVICCVTLEERVPPFLRGTGEGWIKGEYSMLPCSSPSRIPREAVLGRVSGRTHEIQRLIGRSLRAIFDLKAIGERTLICDCDVIQADGGTRCASITGSFMALVDLIDHLMEKGMIERNPIKDAVAAISVGIVDQELMLDLDYNEDLSAKVDFNVVMSAQGRFVEIQGTGEGETFTEDELKSLLRLAKSGIEEVINIQKEVLGERFRW